MTADLPHDPVESLLGAYALDAVDADEAAAIERHLDGCPRCRAELDTHREIAAAIGNSVEPLPLHLWDRIAGEVDAEAAAGLAAVPAPEAAAGLAAVPVPEAAAGLAAVPVPEAAAGLAAVPAPEAAARLTHAPGSRPRATISAPTRIAAALVLAALVGVGALAANLSSAHGRIGTLEQELARGGGQAQVAAALRSPGHRTVVLRSPSGAALAELVVLTSGRGYLVQSTMPALPAGQTYQLWAIIGGQPISAGLLGNRPGQAAFTLASTSPSSMAVTVEPAGGSPTPNGTMVATGPLVRA
jgi:anti-sigma-K factor RskA